MHNDTAAELGGSIARLDYRVEQLQRSLHALWQAASRTPGFIDALAAPDPEDEPAEPDETPRLHLVKGGAPDAG